LLVLASRRIATQRSIQVGPEILGGLDPHAQLQQCRRQVLLTGITRSPFDGGLDRS